MTTEQDTTELVALNPEMELKKFQVTPEMIKQELEAKYGSLVIAGQSDKDGYRKVSEARSEIRVKRLEVEKTRKALVEDAVAYQRKINSYAKELTALIEPIEAHLVAELDAFEAEKERIKAERLAAEQRRVESLAKMLLEAGMTFDGISYSYKDYIVKFLDIPKMDEEGLQIMAEAVKTQKEKDEADAREEQARLEAERQQAIKVAEENARIQREIMEKQAAEIKRQQEEANALRAKLEAEEAERKREQAAAEAKAKADALAMAEERKAMRLEQLLPLGFKANGHRYELVKVLRGEPKAISIDISRLANDSSVDFTGFIAYAKEWISDIDAKIQEEVEEVKAFNEQFLKKIEEQKKAEADAYLKKQEEYKADVKWLVENEFPSMIKFFKAMKKNATELAHKELPVPSKKYEHYRSVFKTWANEADLQMREIDQYIEEVKGMK
jgi:hypothetical protein